MLSSFWGCCNCVAFGCRSVMLVVIVVVVALIVVVCLVVGRSVCATCCGMCSSFCSRSWWCVLCFVWWIFAVVKGAFAVILVVHVALVAGGVVVYMYFLVIDSCNMVFLAYLISGCWGSVNCGT